MATSVRLTRQSMGQPWGFRIHGGADFSQPLIIVKVTAGSLAAQNGLAPGDQFVQINGKDALRMKHKEAQDLIMGAGNTLDLQVARAGSSTWKPQVQVLGEANRAPAGAPMPQRGDVVVNNQYNTPIGMYSEQSIAETITAQSEVLAGGAIGVNFKKNEKKYNHENSEVYKMLQEVESEDGSSGRTPPAQMSPRSTVPVQPVTLPQVQLRSVAPKPAPPPVAQAATHISPAAPAAPAPIQAPTQSVSAPQSAPAGSAPAGGAGNPNVCAECERLIVGVFVRIKDKNLHVECFKCNTCGQSLKNVGYYNINNKLYCDVHAKTVARQNPPAPGLEPVTAPPTGGAPYMGGPVAPPQAPSSYAPVTPPKPFSLTSGIRPQSPNVDSYASKVAPIPFHQSPTSGISHVTAPRSPLSRPSYQQQQQQQSSQVQQQQQIPQPGGGLLQQYSSSYESSSSFSSSSVTQQSSTTQQQGGSGLRVQWPPSPSEGGISAPGADLAGAAPSSAPQPQSLLQQAPAPAPSAAPSQYSTFGQSLGQQQQFKPVTPPKFQQKQVPYKPLSTLLQPAAGRPTTAPVAAPSLVQQTIPPPSAPAPAPSLIQQTIPPPSAPAPAPISIPRPAAPAPAPMAPPSAPAPAPAAPGAAGGGAGAGGKGVKSLSILPKRGRGVLTQPGPRVAICSACQTQIRGPFITANSKFYCPDHFKCATPNCGRPLMDVGFIEEKGNLHCEFCWESHIAPQCGRCRNRIKYECLNAIGQSFHPECFACRHCNKPFGNNPFFLEDGEPYCDADWNELFTTKCYACGFPIEAGDRWVEAIGQNYHSQCFNCAACKKNLEGQSFFAKAGRPFCKSHAR